MDNKEIQEAYERAEKNYKMLKDRVHEQYFEIERYKNIVDKIREYMLDTDWKMGWQYVDYLDKLVKEELKGE